MKPRVGEALLVHVDVTLIDEMLRLTPKQRLEQNDRMATLAVRLRTAFEAGRGRPGRTSSAVDRTRHARSLTLAAR